jgi:hypothetical protein
MKRLGVLPEDLELRTFESFGQVGLPEAAQVLRFNHYEMRRQERLQEVLAERARVLEDELSAKGSASAVSELQSVERILDDESRALEKRLRGQAHARSIQERAQLQLLEKESSLRAKLEYADQRREAAVREKEERSERVRQDLHLRHAGAAEVKQELEAAHEVRAAEYEAAQIQTMEKVRRLQAAKAQERASRQSEWSARRAMLRERQEAQELSTAVKAQHMREKWQNKLSQVGAKKEEQTVAKMLAGEEHTLRLLDAQERAARQMRAEEYKREQQRQELLSQQSRVATMQEVKSQLQEQRAARARKLAAQAKALPPRARDLTPGPADYGERQSCMAEHQGHSIPRASGAPAPGTVEEALKRSKSLPPPGSYDPRCLRKGDALGAAAPRPGGVITKGPKPSAISEAVKRGVPGPGAYETNKSTVDLEHGVRLKPPLLAEPLVPREDGPGPAAYALDPALRERRLRKEQPGAGGVVSKALQPNFPPRR